MNFKENDKIIVMGGKNAMADDAGFKMLMQYEKHNLSNLQKTYDVNLHDVADLERGFLEKPKQVEMGKKLEKKVKFFNEEAERHLETLDGMNIITDATPENQVIIFQSRKIKIGFSRRNGTVRSARRSSMESRHS